MHEPLTESSPDNEPNNSASPSEESNYEPDTVTNNKPEAAPINGPEPTQDNEFNRGNNVATDGNASSSSNKRKFEEDDGSSTQPPKEGFKQNTSDITPDQELPDYGRGTED